MASSPYETYVADLTKDIGETLRSTGCQPILFIGSGLSRRYFDHPTWEELLVRVGKECPLITREYAYYKQTLKSPQKIGSEFAKLYQEWAWGPGRSSFPEELFQPDVPMDAYIKHRVSSLLRGMTPKTKSKLGNSRLQGEIKKLVEIEPHAIITTNFDQLLELLFPDYKPIVGHNVIRQQAFSVGEIFKIHGCITSPNSLVLIEEDYNRFLQKKKYLSAKLTTFFSEHVLVFMGYSIEDPNIKAILSDIDEILFDEGDVINTIYFLDWKEGVTSKRHFAKEKLIPLEGGKTVRVKAIEADDFNWVYEAFSQKHAINNVSPRTLRSLLSRSYHLVRCDIPRKKLEVDFSLLEHAVESDEAFAKLFGVTTITDASIISAKYPYTLTQVGRKLGYSSWHGANKLIEKVKEDKGVDIKAFDNAYCYSFKYGSTPIHKYSEDSIALLKLVKRGLEYSLIP